MPYKCVHCNQIYEDGSKEILTGCTSCRGKFFFYIKKDKVEQVKQEQNKEEELSETEKLQIEQDVREIVGVQDEETPVFLDFESVKVMKPGKYLIDVAKLFSKETPKVYQLEDGKYIVDLANARPRKEQQ